MKRLSVLGGSRGSGWAWAPVLTVVGTFAATFLTALPAAAVDHPAIGSGYAQKQGSTRRTLKVKSKDPNVSLPASDPTVLGGTLLVELIYGTNTLTESINLPGSGWKVSPEVKPRAAALRNAEY